MTGEAFEVAGQEINQANQLYSERYGDKPQRLKEAQSQYENVRAYYKFIPKEIMVFDENSDEMTQLLPLDRSG